MLPKPTRPINAQVQKSLLGIDQLLPAAASDGRSHGHFREALLAGFSALA
jgi:hypothetical protein